MPLYDYHCEMCGKDEERASTISARHEQDCSCGGHLTKLVTIAPSVAADTIIGGFTQEHFGDQPETFYSKRAMLKRADDLGLKPFVRHVGDQGSDKSKRTSRWI